MKVRSNATGRLFEKWVKAAIEKKYRRKFKKKRIAIGRPAKNHEYDLVSKDGKIAIECKSYSWVGGNGAPWAKVATLSEAVLFMTFLPKRVKKIIVMKRSVRRDGGETLAEFCVRTNKHIYIGVTIAEYDHRKKKLRAVHGKL